MYSTLIVPLDGSPFAAQAIAPAMFLSAQMHATLRLVHVHESAPNPTYRAPAWDEFFRAQDEAYLESLAERIQSGVTTTVDCSVLDGDVVMAICASIEASASPLVIMSTHGRTGIRRAWLGGVTTGVLRHSPAPVLVVRPHGEDPAVGRVPTDAPFADVIVALDGSAFAEQILPHAVRLARVSHAHLVLLRVVDAGVSDSEAEDASAYLKGVAARFADGCPPPDARVETHRTPAAAILALAAASPRPLVAMASHGRGLSRLFLGSVADEVMRRTSGAVLVIRPRV